MNKIALVTGVTGQDGSLLSRFLLDKEYTVIGIDRRKSSPNDWRIKELDLYSSSEFQVVSGDLTDQSSIDRLVQAYRPHEFYNLGANSFVADSWYNAESVMNINTLGCLRCLEAIRKFKPDCKFYQASSSEMFGGINRVEMLNEESIFYPRSPYGVSKSAAHWMTVNYRESYNIFTCCGILFNHTGHLRGKEFVERKITDGVARIKLGLQEYIELGNLDAKRDMGASFDYVRAMWMMLQQDKPEDFVIATGKAWSIREMVEMAVDMAELDKPYMEYIKYNKKFDRPSDVGYLLGDASKAREVLGWEPEVDFDSMVKIMVEKDIDRVRNANN